MGSDQELLGFVDSDFAGDHTDRKSTTGYIFLLASGALSRRSTNKLSWPLPISEAEYVAISTAAMQLIWLKSLAMCVGLVTSGVVCLSGDNQTDLRMAEEAKLTEASKDIAIYYYFKR